ncbi:MAG: MFS transporter [Myxococcales bacterium]|nr:MFS transporter [Myxococcales bacterium]
MSHSAAIHSQISPQNQLNQLRLVTWSYWLSTFSEGATRILIPLYFHSLGMKITKIAFMFLCYELCGLLANMIAGFWLNRNGYRKAFLCALGLHTVASAGYLFLGPMGSGWLLLAWVSSLRATRGVAKEVLKTTSSSYVKHLQTHHMQTHFLLGGKDSAKGIGLLLGGLLLTFFGFTGSFLLLGLSTALCMLWAWFTLEDFRETKSISFRSFGQVESRMTLLATGRALLYAGRDLWLVLALPIYLSTAGVSKISVGAILALGLVTFGLVQPVSGWWIKRRFVWRQRTLKAPWLYERVLGLSSLCLALIPLMMVFLGQQIAVAVALIILYNILSGIATAPHNDLQLRFARKERASVDIAYYKTISQIGKICAVFFSGLLFAKWGLSGCLWASFGCLVLSSLLGLWITSLSQKTPQAQKFLQKYVQLDT